MTTTKADVAALLENFAEYRNPAGVDDPWFRVTEINQQFAWEDIDLEILEGWLDSLVADGLVETHSDDEGIKEWRWLA